jgi:hypothetical protein
VVRNLVKFEFSPQILKNFPRLNFIKILFLEPSFSVLTDERTDMTKLIINFEILALYLGLVFRLLLVVVSAIKSFDKHFHKPKYTDYILFQCHCVRYKWHMVCASIKPGPSVCVRLWVRIPLRLWLSLLTVVYCIQKSLQQSDPSSRGVLQSVACHWVRSNSLPAVPTISRKKEIKMRKKEMV